MQVYSRADNQLGGGNQHRARRAAPEQGEVFQLLRRAGEADKDRPAGQRHCPMGMLAPQQFERGIAGRTA